MAPCTCAASPPLTRTLEKLCCRTSPAHPHTAPSGWRRHLGPVSVDRCEEKGSGRPCVMKRMLLRSLSDKARPRQSLTTTVILHAPRNSHPCQFATLAALDVLATPSPVLLPQPPSQPAPLPPELPTGAAVSVAGIFGSAMGDSSHREVRGACQAKRKHTCKTGTAPAASPLVGMLTFSACRRRSCSSRSTTQTSWRTSTRCPHGQSFTSSCNTVTAATSSIA